jgi:hypothetical protein
MTALVKSVEHFVLSTSGTSDSDTLTLGQDIDQCVPMLPSFEISDTNGDGPGVGQAQIYFSSTDTLNLSRYHTLGTITANIPVVEWDDAVSVWSGTWTIDDGNTFEEVEFDATGATAVTEAFLVISCDGNTSDSDSDSNTVQAFFVDAKTVRFERQVNDGDLSGRYFVVNHEDLDVEHDNDSSTGNTLTQSITTVTPASAFLITTVSADDASEAPNTLATRSRLGGSGGSTWNEVYSYRQDGGGSMFVSAQVVKSPTGEFTVERGETSFTTTSTQAITEINRLASVPKLSAAYYPKPDSDGINDAQKGSCAVAFSKDNELTFVAGAAGDNEEVWWEVISFALTAVSGITPICVSQDEEQSTTSTSYVDADCETEVLASGVDYLVIYCGNLGDTGTSGRAYMQLLHGSTAIGYAAGEGSGLGVHGACGQIQGYALATGNGTDTLKFQFRTVSATAYAGAMSIIAIPLTELTEGIDYWFDGTSSSTLEVQDASTSWETLRSANFSIPDSGDYLVLMSCEGRPNGASNTTASRTRYLIESTYIAETEAGGVGTIVEWEWDGDYNNHAMATMETLTAGSKTFKIECASRTSATTDFRRSNMFVFRKASFDQIVQTRDSTGDSSITSTSYVDFSGLDTTYTPNQDEYVIALGYAIPGNDSAQITFMQLYNDSDSMEFRVDSGMYGNYFNGTGGGFTTSSDLVPTIMANCKRYVSAKDWNVQCRVTAQTGKVGRSRDNTSGIESNVIFWGLTPSGDVPVVSASRVLFFSRIL